MVNVVVIIINLHHSLTAGSSGTAVAASAAFERDSGFILKMGNV